MTRAWLIAWCLVMSGAAAVNAQAETFTSPSRQVPLIELYTSEGCSSCPPADAWLSGLRDDPGLWEAFVPVAFHVTYWDDLGWKDPPGSVAFTERQGQYAALWGSRGVYTPGVVLNGTEWRAWRRARPGTLGTGDAAGVLRMERTGVADFSVTFRPAAEASSAWRVTVALLGMGIRSDVTRGENAGKQLRHDFVVLDVAQQALTAHEGVLAAEVTLRARADIRSARQAAAAWVERDGAMVPRQATGGFLDAPVGGS